MERSKMDALLIAPCGMNCRLCIAYFRKKRRCLGCNSDSETKSVHCAKCSIKNCDVILSNKSKFCYECDKFPCRRLKQLDSRYRLKYKMSMLENLEYIKDSGMDKFLNNEAKRWMCAECGDIICVHEGCCLNCKSSFR